MDFAEKTPMVKNTVVGVERAISQFFFQGGGGGGLETEKAILCLGVVYIFFSGVGPFPFHYTNGGEVGFVGRLGGMVVVCFQVGVLFSQVWEVVEDVSYQAF